MRTTCGLSFQDYLNNSLVLPLINVINDLIPGRRSGLSAYLAAQLGGLRSLDPWQTNLIIAVATTFITEVGKSLDQPLLPNPLVRNIVPLHE